MVKVKIKDLPTDFSLVGCKLGEMFIVSGWNKGFWLKKKGSDTELLPAFFKDFDSIKDWVIDVPPLRAIFLKQKNNKKSKKKTTKNKAV